MLTLLASGLLAPGCAYGAGELELQTLARTAHDAAPTAEDWREAQALAGRGASRGRYVLLPGWASGDLAVVGDDGDSLTRVEFSVANLGLTVLPLLPLWWVSDARHDDEDGDVSTVSMLWTPLWASSHAEGWPDDVAAPSAWGVPLLYGRVRYGTADEARLDVHTSLWTLGPSWITADLEHDDERITGWNLLPVTLAGFGQLVWTSGETTTVSPRGEEHASVHGPLAGYLGYRSETSPGESTHSLVAGLLWYGHAVGNTEGDVSDAYYGPLWAMFGWGRTHGRPCVRLLWFPIPVD